MTSWRFRRFFFSAFPSDSVSGSSFWVLHYRFKMQARYFPKEQVSKYLLELSCRLPGDRRKSISSYVKSVAIRSNLRQPFSRPAVFWNFFLIGVPVSRPCTKQAQGKSPAPIQPTQKSRQKGDSWLFQPYKFVRSVTLENSRP